MPHIPPPPPPWKVELTTEYDDPPAFEAGLVRMQPPPSSRMKLTVTYRGEEVFVMRSLPRGFEAQVEWRAHPDLDAFPLIALVEAANRRKEVADAPGPTAQA